MRANAASAGHPTGHAASATPGSVLKQVLRVVLWLSFAGWLGGHLYSFLGTWSKYQLQYSRKYEPYIAANCANSKFHEITLGLNHCDDFMEAVAIPAWERALFEEIQKLPVCANGKCDSIVSEITNNKTWLSLCFVTLLLFSVAMLRIKWYLETQIRNNLPLDDPAAYIETLDAPSYVDRDGKSWLYQVGLRRRINTETIDRPNAEGCKNTLTVEEYSDVTL